MQGSEQDEVSVNYQGSTFNVGTSLSNGSIEGMDIDPSNASIILRMNASATVNGNLTVFLPRTLIDSNVNGSDTRFTVLVDSKAVDYEESNTTPAERELVIPIPKGTQEVKIIGTQVVPEFPVGAIAVMGTLVAVATTVSRFRNLQN